MYVKESDFALNFDLLSKLDKPHKRNKSLFKLQLKLLTNYNQKLLYEMPDYY